MACNSSPSVVAPLPVVAQQVISASLPTDLQFSGTLVVREEVDISAQVGGHITSLSVDTGDRVVQGGIIAQLDTNITGTIYQSITQNLQEAQTSYEKLMTFYGERLASARTRLEIMRQTGQEAISLVEVQLRESQKNGLSSTQSLNQAAIELARTQLQTASDDLERQAQTILTNIAIIVESVADSLDQILQVSDKYPRKANLLSLLGALDPDTRTAAVMAVAELLITCDDYREQFDTHILDTDPDATIIDTLLLTAKGTSKQAKLSLEKVHAMFLASILAPDILTDDILDGYKSMVSELGQKVESTLLSINNLIGDEGVASQIAILEKQLVSAESQAGASEQNINSKITILEQQLSKTRIDIAAQIQQAELDIDILQREKEVNLAEAQAAIVHLQGQQQQQLVTLRNTTVVAPHGGIVLQKYAEVGQVVASGQPIIRLADDTYMKLEVGIPDTLVSSLIIDQKAEIYIDSFEQAFSARISKIGATADPISKKVTVELQLENPQNQLKAGLFARATFTLFKEEGMVVPLSAVINRYGRKIVFIHQDGRAQIRTVQIGNQTDTSVLIRDGIEAGEEVITKGQQYLRDGDPVVIQNYSQTDD